VNVRQIRSANAEYQVLDALRTNRQTRNRENAFLVEGVRNIDAALAHGWRVHRALAVAGARRSTWAQSVIARVDDVVELTPELFATLTDRDEPPELLLVVEKRTWALDDVVVDDDCVLTVLDRPTNPGNIGTIIRGTDALGGRGVIVIGHGADPYDPRSVRASTGSFFALPIIEIDRVEDLRAWGVRLVATDEGGTDIASANLAPPVALLFGNETRGLSRALRDEAELTVAIPMRSGTASSLNVAAAHAIVLYEVYRRKHDAHR
jgi:TrmH family RNA methyltransferase